ISAVWPENIHVSRFCCECVTHDEATIGELIDAAELRDQPKFESVIKGLIRPDRVHRLWEGACDLIAAEYRRA
ncbi:MAG: DNA-directed RNA polymerase subunit beta', partial [Pseudomonadota bacterium]